jgi:hypothetical protein
MEPNDLVETLGETIGTSKAEKLVDEALDELGINESDFGEEEAKAVLEEIPNLDDASLVSVAANTTKTQLIR